jgi:lysophospholipid acyltransferase (LPLAT)-like uncharacterized protein
MKEDIEDFIMIRAKMLSFIFSAVVALWSRSLRISYVNRGILDHFTSKKKNVIYAFWHDSIFLLPYTHRNSGIMILVSESKDGEIATGILRRFGYEVVRGSSKRRGTRALIELFDSMRKGKSVAITADGPRGPRYEAKEGAVFLAGKLQAPIIPVATGVKRFWTLERSWDKLVLPAPFTEGVVLYGEPIMVNGTSREEIETKRRELEAALIRLTREAAARMVVPQGVRSVFRKAS